MATLTLHDVPEDLAEALDRERARRGTSVGATVLDLLREALGVGARRTNGLERFAGDWTREDVEEFEAAIAEFERIDEPCQ